MKNIFLIAILALRAFVGSSEVSVPDSNPMCKVPQCVEAVGITPDAISDAFYDSIIQGDLSSRIQIGNYTYEVDSINPDFAAVRRKASMIVQSACEDPTLLCYLAQVLDKKAFMELLALKDGIRKCSALDIMSHEPAEAFYEKINSASNALKVTNQHMMQHARDKKMRKNKRNQ